MLCPNQQLCAERVKKQAQQRVEQEGQHGQRLAALLDSKLELLSQQLRSKADRNEIKRLEAQLAAVEVRFRERIRKFLTAVA